MKQPTRRLGAERGMALLMSLVLLLIVSLLGMTSMQSALLQEKMALSLSQRQQSFQAAEAALRLGEGAVARGGLQLAPCTRYCAPPAESLTQTRAGLNMSSGVTWIATEEGLYSLQNLGPVVGAVQLPSTIEATLYRVTAIGLAGTSRSVLESIYATY